MASFGVNSFLPSHTMKAVIGKRLHSCCGNTAACFMLTSEFCRRTYIGTRVGQAESESLGKTPKTLEPQFSSCFGVSMASCLDEDQHHCCFKIDHPNRQLSKPTLQSLIAQSETPGLIYLVNIIINQLFKFTKTLLFFTLVSYINI